MKSFIDFLLEKKSKQPLKTHMQGHLLHESQAVTMSFYDIFRVIQDAGGGDNIVKIVDKDGKTYDVHKEFEWPGEKQLTAPIVLPTTTSNTPSKVGDLFNDANNVIDVLDTHEISLKAASFQLKIGTKTTSLVGSAFDSQSKTLYLGFECDPEKVLKLQNQQAASAPSGTPIKFGTKTMYLQELPTDATMAKLKTIAANEKNTDGYAVIYGCYGLNLKDFDKNYIQGENKTIVQAFGDELPDSKVKFFKTLSWNVNGMDSFIKRLHMIALLDDGTILLALTFGPHPVVARLKAYAVSWVFPKLSFADTGAWLKCITKCYLDAFNISKDGVTILADPHQYFKKSAKFQVQQDPPFVVGKKVSPTIKAKIIAAPNQGGAAPVASASNKPSTPSSALPKNAYGEVNNKFHLAMKKKGLGGITAEVGNGGSGLKHGALRDLPSGQTYMSFRFPGVDPTQMIDQEAIGFLKKFNLWDGKLKPMYDEVKAAIPNVKLAISFDGRFGS